MRVHMRRRNWIREEEGGSEKRGKKRGGEKEE